MTHSVLQSIKSAMFSEAAFELLQIKEDQMIELDNSFENCGNLSPTAEAEDIAKGNKKILLYIDSLRGKQRVITPSQISKELGYSEQFIESILILNGFQED